MKCLSLTQPYATLMALGLKKVETRSWSTSYRGPLAIHAAKRFPLKEQAFAKEQGLRVRNLPLGAIIATLELEDVLETLAAVGGLTQQERLYGNYEAGRFAWFTDKVVALPTPIPWRGSLGIFNVDVIELVKRAKGYDL